MKVNLWGSERDVLFMVKELRINVSSQTMECINQRLTNCPNIHSIRKSMPGFPDFILNDRYMFTSLAFSFGEPRLYCIYPIEEV